VVDRLFDSGVVTMHRVVVDTKVGCDGIVHLAVPVGADAANRDVRVTVEPIAAGLLTPKSWQDFVWATAGSVTDETFERPPQGTFEQRNPLT
jgi:hypothetical protein